MRARPLLLAVVTLLALWAHVAGAQDYGRPLSREQVDCEERQLERLLHRMTVGWDGSNLFVWRSSPLGGLYRGLATTSEMFLDQPYQRLRREKQLAFDLVFKAGQDFLDPRRPRLPQATLVRRDAASNLVTLPNVFTLDVRMDLAPEVPDPSEPQQPMRISINRFIGPASDDRAGRGIAIGDLLGSCHSEVSEFDLAVYEILARTVRASQCLLEGALGCAAGLFNFKTVFFRGEEPLTYRMNIFSYLIACSDERGCHYGEARMAFLFRLQVDEQGRLTGGDLKTLPLCTDRGQVGCSDDGDPGYGLFVMPPMIPGVEEQGEPEYLRAAHLNLDYDGSPDNVLEDTVDWQDLLRGTTWSEGLIPRPPAPAGERAPSLPE